MASNPFEELLKQLLVAMVQMQTEDDVIKKHTGVVCDFCKVEDFEGDRYHCTVCANSYDLCTNCFCMSRFSLEHKLRHPMLCITNPLNNNENQKLHSANAIYHLANHFNRTVHKNITCDECSKDVVGVRIKCDTCWNNDFCFECWKKGCHSDHPMIMYVSDILQHIPFQNLEMGKPLGAGCFGNVIEARLKPKRDLVACKIVDSQNQEDGKMNVETCLKSLLTEINAHAEIRSAFICKVLGYSFNVVAEHVKFCILMEYMHNGSLTSIIENENKGVSHVPIARKFMMLGDIACGLKDLHRKNYIHTDIKPDNILVNARFIAKISDLGIVKNRNLPVTDTIGSAQYLPIEFQSGTYDETVDLYSFGLVMYHLMTGKPHMLLLGMFPLLSDLNTIKVPIIAQLITDSTSMDPTKRLSADYYKCVLRSYSEVFMALVEQTGHKDTYKGFNSTQKDMLFYSIQETVSKVVLNKLKLKSHLESNGLSKNDLNTPETDGLLFTLAATMHDIEQSNTTQQTEVEDTGSRDLTPDLDSPFDQKTSVACTIS